jgi:mannosyltransferase
MRKNASLIFLFFSLAVLLIAAAALTYYADDLGFWFDEGFSVFHASRSMEQILLDHDAGWSPGYYLLLHGWIRFAGMHDFVLHSFGVFVGLLSTAMVIRVGTLLHSRTAGLIAALAFGTSSYALTFNLELRGYNVMLLLIFIYLYLYLRWHREPTRPLWIGAVNIVQIIMLYTHLIVFVVIGLVSLHAMLTRPRYLLRWIFIGVATVVAFSPLLPQFVGLVQKRSGGGELPSYFRRELLSFYQAYSAHADLLFAVILIAAMIGLAVWVTKRRDMLPTLGIFVVWGVIAPLVAYILRERLPMFTTRYLTFTIPAAMLLIGIGLAALNGIVPRVRLPLFGVGAVLLLALQGWQPNDHRPAPSDNSMPLHHLLRELRARAQPADVLLIDPGCTCTPHPMWDYYTSIYSTPEIIHSPAEIQGRRVWHLVRQGSETLTETVRQGRVMRDFWGPWYMAATLYEAPPMPDGLLFGESVRFLGADVLRPGFLHNGDTFRVRLWWSVDAPTGVDYSVSVQLRDSLGNIIAQADGSPVIEGRETPFSALVPDAITQDERTLTVPYGSRAGDYTLHVSVYQWWDGVRLEPERGIESLARFGYSIAPDSTLIIDNVHLITFAFG